MHYGGVIKIETQGSSQGSIIGDVVNYTSDSQYLSPAYQAQCYLQLGLL